MSVVVSAVTCSICWWSLASFIVAIIIIIIIMRVSERKRERESVVRD